MKQRWVDIVILLLVVFFSLFGSSIHGYIHAKGYHPNLKFWEYYWLWSK